MDKDKLGIIIVGAGKGGTSILEVLSDEPDVEIRGVVDRNPGAGGINEARKRGIPVYSSIEEATVVNGVDLVFNVTGDESISGLICEKFNDGAAYVGGNTARFFWMLFESKKKSLEDLKRLYEIQIKLDSFTSTDSLFGFFLEKAMELTGTDAASMAIYDERMNELKTVASKGFSDEFMRGSFKWNTRAGGLTAAILNSRDPVVIDDAEGHPLFTNGVLKKEGVKALMASTIKSENRILGISYVDSFSPRKFSEREITAFKLLTTQAAAAVEKTHIIENFHKLAYEDELTGLSNYRHFLETCSSELVRAKRNKRPFSIILMDVDRFKDYNDTFGHQAGNYVLEKIGSIMRVTFRSTDLPARFGGEEFVVIISETSKPSALKRAEELRHRFSQELSRQEDPQILRDVTLSMGVATFPDDGRDLETLINKADSALYRAKEGGRNRVEPA